MIIDFHVHAFADALASRAMEKLIACIADSGLPYPAVSYSDGTVKGALDMLSRNGIDKAVLLPVATKPSQFDTVNEWSRAEAEKDSRLIPFGAVHPDDENIHAHLEELVQRGYKGIKLHPDYQGFYADEERMMPIYRRCAELGLIIVFHTGTDAMSPHEIHATPQMMARVFDKVDGLTAVLAHMGGLDCHDDAVRLLAGGPAYFDTAYMNGMSPERFTELVRAYGADRVLFASDCPWNDSADDLALVRGSFLSGDEKERILGLNAAGLLGIQAD
ncbi:MAG: amidohydrolase family protein [Huintestinicola sp.]